MFQHILRSGEDVGNEAGRHNAQIHFAVQTAEGQVVNLVAERRNIGAFRRVDVQRQEIVAVE